MLGARVLTAAVLAPLVVLSIVTLPSDWFSFFLALIVLGGAWEWAALSGWRGRLKRAGYSLSMAVLMWGMMPHAFLFALWPWLALLSLVWWCIALVWIIRFERGGDPLVPRIDILAGHRGVGRALSGFAILLPAWGALTVLHQQSEQGPYRVLFLVLLIWAADTGAYFAGKLVGRRHMLPRVSPGKTWEGVAGGLLAVGLFTVFASDLVGLSSEGRLAFVFLALATGGISVLGDVTESLFKRLAGCKDSGYLLPGHGGVLDRIDSLTAAAPLFVLGLLGLSV